MERRGTSEEKKEKLAKKQPQKEKPKWQEHNFRLPFLPIIWNRNRRRRPARKEPGDGDKTGMALFLCSLF